MWNSERVDVDGNNNIQDDQNIFGKSKRYDSGLEIISPQSNESLDFFSAKDNNANPCSTLTLPAKSVDKCSPVGNYYSLNFEPNKPQLAQTTTRNIIEFKMTNSTTDAVSTNVVIYKNEHGNIRHMRICDSRKLAKPKDPWLGGMASTVRRSNTFNHTPMQSLQQSDQMSRANSSCLYQQKKNQQWQSPHRSLILLLEPDCSSKYCQMPQDFSEDLQRQQQQQQQSEQSIPIQQTHCDHCGKPKKKKAVVSSLLSCFRCFIAKKKSVCITTSSSNIADATASGSSTEDHSRQLQSPPPSAMMEEGYHCSLGDSQELTSSTGSLSAEESCVIIEDGPVLGSSSNGLNLCDVDDENDEEMETAAAETEVVGEDDEDEEGSQTRFGFDQFDNMQYLNSGAEGVVYTAELDGRQTVALKTFSRSPEIDMRHLLQLNHRNIVKFIGTCHAGEKNYIVMEYCSEGELYQLLRRDNYDISTSLLLSWARQVCEGMAYLHTQEIVHRDLKSLNVLLTKGNVLKIIDFGFGKNCNETNYLDSFVGTFAWMAPEIIRKEGYTKKVDVWSYGVLIWELITRKIPYFGVESFAIIYGVGDSCLTLPIPQTFPKKIHSFLEMCWSRELRNRPSFQEILDNFDDYFYELHVIDNQLFKQMQNDWSSEIDQVFDNMTQSQVSSSKVEVDLIRRRTKELSDARDIKRLYNEKLARADRLILLLNKCLDAVEKDRKKNEREWSLIQNWKKIMKLQSSGLTSDEQRMRNGQKTSPRHMGSGTAVQNRYSMTVESQMSKSNTVPPKRKHSIPLHKCKTIITASRELYQTRIRPQRRNGKKKSISCEALNVSKSGCNGSTAVSATSAMAIASGCSPIHRPPQKPSTKVKRSATSVMAVKDRLQLTNLACHYNSGSSSLQPTSSDTITNRGSVNPTFVGADDRISAATGKDQYKIKKTTFKLHNLPIFGGINSNQFNYSTMEHSPHHNRNSSGFSNIMTDSINESPNREDKGDCTDRSSTVHSSSNSRTTCDEVVLRDISGRKCRCSDDSDGLVDSIELSANKEKMNDSIVEKEKKAQNVIQKDQILLQLASDNQFNPVLPVGIPNQPSHSPPSAMITVIKNSFDSHNMSLWSPKHN